ncbi:MAG: undecaprenyl-diphosphatase [Paraglaciecola sp.]|jgi:undecaprenyl-diphosphatase
MKTLTKTDMELFNWLFKLTAEHDCRWVKWLSKTGDGQIYLFIGLMLWMFEPQDGKLFLYTALLAYALELPIYVVLKKCLKRQRPCHMLHNFKAHITPSDKFSLPSGHTAAAFLMASLISAFYPSLTIIVYVWAAFIGFSRVLLGVHYPSDILAGVLLGMSISAISLNLL